MYTRVSDFVDYVLSFYGPGELYDFGVTREEVVSAMGRLIELRAADKDAIPFEGDSVDREHVRDIIIKMRG
jgi:hypothetical protein